MKDKRILAMFITSIVTFVASLTISLGVAFALADPASAVGLEEFQYDMTTSTSISKELTFNPSDAYRGEIENAEDHSKDVIFVQSYDSIQYCDGILSNSIKLVKIAITNDTNSSIGIQIAISTDSEATNKFLKSKIYCVSGTESNSQWATTVDIAVQANSTGYLVVATYVDDTFDCNGIVDFATSKNMTIKVSKMEI